jgi:hypothetical protein
MSEARCFVGSVDNRKREAKRWLKALRSRHSDIRDGDAVAAALLGYATTWQVPGQPEGASRMLNAADPDASAILVRMRSRRPSSQMPPLGTVLRDDQAIAAVSKWLATDLAHR